MDNSFSIVTYHNPYYDFPSTDEFLMFDEKPSVGFSEVESVGEFSAFGALVSESQVIGFADDCTKSWDDNDLLQHDSFILEMINESSLDTVGNSGIDASGNNGERVGEANIVDFQIIPQASETGNQMQHSVSQFSYNCTFCHILREIIHVKGICVRNLEIHGRVGIISHVVLEEYDLDSSSENHENQMFDFGNESIGTVKTFLIQYYEDCRREGYHMLEDPLLHFYHALCIGYNEKVNGDLPGELTGDLQTNQQNLARQQDYESNGIRPFRSDRQTIHNQQEGEGKVGVCSRSFLATQRERTGKMKLKDFSGYFDLPIHEAAKRMNVCPTVIKKKCRQGGLSRWPYRKIKGIKRKIVKKQEILRTGTPEVRVCAADDIQMLEQELQNIFAKFSQ